MSDTVFIPVSAALVILELMEVTTFTSQQDDGDLSTIAIEPLYGWESAPGSPTPLLDTMSERTLSVRFNWKERDLVDPRKRSTRTPLSPSCSCRRFMAAPAC